jgi:hypothetical protein
MKKYDRAMPDMEALSFPALNFRTGLAKVGRGWRSMVYCRKMLIS